jgi:hypothetical protein
MNQYDYFKGLPEDSIKEILYKTPASDIIFLSMTDIYIYRIYATMKLFPTGGRKNLSFFRPAKTKKKKKLGQFSAQREALRWKGCTIKNNRLPYWTVNMWDRLLDDHGLTWKELARLYESETLSGYKLQQPQGMETMRR